MIRLPLPRLMLGAAAFAAAVLPVHASDGLPPCANPVYLTVDPANMDFAPRIAEVLRRQQVQTTSWGNWNP